MAASRQQGVGGDDAGAAAVGENGQPVAADGLSATEKFSTAPSRSPISFTLSMPARRNAASQTLSAPARAPVWETTARTVCGNRPLLTMTTGFRRAAARPADMNFRASLIASA